MTWTLMILRLAWDGDTCDMPLEQGISKLLHPYEVIVQTMVDCIVCKQKAQKKKWKLIKFLFSLKLQKSNIYPCTGYGSVFYIFSLIQRYVDLLCVWEKKGSEFYDKRQGVLLKFFYLIQSNKTTPSISRCKFSLRYVRSTNIVE